ncbi:MAG: hypothetical protein ACTS44_00215 [Candidatus Hodgkinia cicadicola]
MLKTYWDIISIHPSLTIILNYTQCHLEPAWPVYKRYNFITLNAKGNEGLNYI